MKQQLHIGPPGYRRLVVYLIAMTVTFSGMQQIRADLDAEYEAKLDCLYKLASYVEYTGGVDQSRIRLGILGRDPFGRALDQLAAKRKAHGKSVVVSRFRTPNDYKACDILFMGRDVDLETLRKFSDRISKQCVLIVGEHPQFTANGGIVNLIIKDDGKAAIQLNLEAAHARGLMIDARLLRVCQIVDPGVAAQ